MVYFGVSKQKTIDLDKISKLANLPTPANRETFEENFTKILNYIEVLQNVDTSSVVPTYNVTSSSNNFRQDVVRDGLTQAESLSNTKNNAEGYVLTKGVFDNE